MAIGKNSDFLVGQVHLKCKQFHVNKSLIRFEPASQFKYLNHWKMSKFKSNDEVQLKSSKAII